MAIPKKQEQLWIHGNSVNAHLWTILCIIEWQIGKPKALFHILCCKSRVAPALLGLNPDFGIIWGWIVHLGEELVSALGVLVSGVALAQCCHQHHPCSQKFPLSQQLPARLEFAAWNLQSFQASCTWNSITRAYLWLSTFYLLFGFFFLVVFLFVLGFFLWFLFWFFSVFLFLFLFFCFVLVFVFWFWVFCNCINKKKSWVVKRIVTRSQLFLVSLILHVLVLNYKFKSKLKEN